MHKAFFVILLSIFICVSCKALNDESESIGNKTVKINDQNDNGVMSNNMSTLTNVTSTIRSALVHMGRNVILVIIKSITFISPVGFILNLFKLFSVFHNLIITFYYYVTSFTFGSVSSANSLVLAGISRVNRSAQDTVNKISNQAIESLWIVSKNYVFPNLDMIMMKVKDWPSVPTLLQVCFQQIHSMYMLLQFLGYLRPE